MRFIVIRGDAWLALLSPCNTGLTMVDVETAADEVHIAIISYDESVPSSLGALREVSGVCNSDLTYIY